MDKAGADLGGGVLAVLRAGAVTGVDSVPIVLLIPDEAPATAVGNVAELRDVDVNQFAGWSAS